MITYLRRRLKALVAFATAAVTSGQTFFGPNDPRLNTVLLVIGAIGVLVVENEPMPAEADFWHEHDHAQHRLDEPPPQENS